jgi:hypothetical protein
MKPDNTTYKNLYIARALNEMFATHSKIKEYPLYAKGDRFVTTREVWGGIENDYKEQLLKHKILIPDRVDQLVVKDDCLEIPVWALDLSKIPGAELSEDTLKAQIVGKAIAQQTEEFRKTSSPAEQLFAVLSGLGVTNTKEAQVQLMRLSSQVEVDPAQKEAFNIMVQAAKKKGHTKS